MNRSSIGVLVFLTAAMVVSCAPHRAPDGTETVSYRTMISRNVVNLNDLSVGMRKSEVMETMGTFIASTPNSIVPNPYKTEPFSRGGKQYEVLYYMTRKYPPFTSIKLSQATPVVLEEGRVIGWSRSVLADARAGRLGN